MTAPVKRAGTDDHVGTQKERIRSLEANCCTADALAYDPLYNGVDVYPQGPIHTDGATDPPLGDYFYSNIGSYITGNIVANASFVLEFGPGGPVDPGDGQYLITLPAFGDQAPYTPGQPSFTGARPVVGIGYSWDSSADDYHQFMLRVSPTVTILGGPCLDAFDASGNFLSATFPFTWSTEDIILAGSFTYGLFESLLGQLYY